MRRTTRWFLALLALCVLTCAVVVGLVAATSHRSAPAGSTVLQLELQGTWPERDANAALNRLLGVQVMTLRDLVDSIGAAAHDDAVGAIELRVGDLDVGWARAQEVRDALEAFRASGKPVHAFLEGGDDGSYFLASVADRVSLIETGTLWLDGLSAEVSFYGGTFEKAGLSADLEQIGEYKNAADVMKRKDMSEPHREAMGSLLDGLYDEIVATLAESLDRSPDEVRRLVAAGPYTARQALDAGLVDALGYEDEARTALDEVLGGGEHVRLDAGRYAREVTHPRGERVIAVLDCSGTILSGASGGDVFGGGRMGSATIAEALREARETAGIAAVVLRVDSPGGSPVASDVIWRETQLTREAGIPVVVSMSDVAASGGYWISMGADRVLAQPTTITGSIGIYGGKYVTRGLGEKIGVHVEPLRRGDHAGINSTQAAFTDEERLWLQGGLRSVYELFLERTATGRGFESPAAVDRIARGRVWTGRQALENGLVDELGGLDQAIDVAADLAQLPETDAVDVRWLPAAPTLGEMLFDGGAASVVARLTALSASRQAQAVMPPAIHDLLDQAAALAVLEREKVLALLPFHLKAH